MTAIALLAGVLFAAPSFVLPQPTPGAAGWRALAFPRIEKHTTYARVELDGATVLRAEARCSASGLAHGVDGLDLERTPILRWRWRVDRSLPARDVHARGGDDYAARVYVAFRFDPKRASAWQRVKRRTVALIYGEELPGVALNYVWSETEPAGTSWPNPYTDQARMVSLGAGEAGAFREARADVRADFESHFEGDPPPVAFVALMSDADDGCGEALAYFADLRFEPS